jgi:serine protease AprX
VVKEFSEGRLVKAMYDDKTVKDVMFFNDGTKEVYNETKHGKYFSKDKKSKKLKEKKDKLNDNEKIPVTIWVGDIDHDAIDKNVKDNLKIKDIKDEKAEKIQGYIEEKRKKSKEEYKKQNDKFIKKLIKSEDVLFSSDYSPMVVANIAKKDLDQISNSSEVTEMDCFEDSSKEEDSASSILNTNAKITRDTLYMKGNGVKVGILEVGYPDKNNPELSGSSITFDVPDITANTRKSTHATIVTSIIAGQTQGIAPAVNAFVATSSNRLGDYQKIEWLIDQGVTLINYSAGYSNTAGEYTDMAKWIDHLAVQHDVLFVKSAGNAKYTNNKVTDPGMAYNGVTVASINDNNSVEEPYWGDDTYSNFNCYLENSGPFKPDISAPGESIDIAGFTNNNGTSFSAPHVTGVLAQVLGAYPWIFPRAATLKSLMVTGTSHKTADDYGLFKMSPFISDKEGAGVIDALSMYNCIRNSQYVYENLSSSQFPYNRYLNITADGTPVKVSVVWQKNNSISASPHSDGSVNERDLSDLDLEIYGPDGEQLGYSMSANNNMEVVEFTPSVSGKYSVKINAYALANYSEGISLSWSRGNYTN